MNKFILTLILILTGACSVFAQNTIYKYVDTPAKPNGGLRNFYQYLDTNLKYPAQAKQQKLEGRVMVKFVVEPDGSLSNASIVRSLGGGCDQEALRLIKNAPKWVAGKKAGKPVRAEVIRPITFKLN